MRASEERWSRPIGFTLNVPAEMADLTSSGGLLSRRVSRDEALSVPAVKRGRDLICGTLGTLRLKKHDASRRTVDSELLDQPESDVARSVTMTRIFEDMLFEGYAWLRITEFDSTGYPSKVVRLEPRTVTVRENARVYVSSDGTTQGQATEFVPDAQLIRIDSPNEALLVAGARAIRTAMLLDRTASRYASDPLPLGYFSPADGMADQDPGDVQDVLDEWETSRSERTWGYVGAALKANTLQWSPEQLQLGSARDYAVLEISRLIGVDPEELGVSTTSRTYANAEQRRLDLIDFTCAAYVTAIEDRLSMPDVTPPGYYVRAEYGAFLRSDTKTRMETYELGRKVGVYNDERIAELEDIPNAKPAGDPATAGADVKALVEATQKIYLAVTAGVLSVDEARRILNRLGAGLTIPAPTLTPPPAAPAIPSQPEETVQNTLVPNGAVNFADSEAAVTIGFVTAPDAADFKADAVTRTVSGQVLPWNAVAYSRGYKWMFAPGSLHWAAESRVKLDRDHEYGSELGRAVTLTNGAAGLGGSFKVARGSQGDDILALAEDGVYDGFSVSVTFDSEADGWTAHPDDNSVRLVHSATLRKVAITAMPAFDDARVASVAARREDTPAMTAPAAPQPLAPTPAAPAAPVPPDFAAFTAGLTEAMKTAVTEAFAHLPQPQGVPERQVVPAGRLQSVREAPVYLMNGSGPSLVRDTWKARTEGDHEAAERLRKFGLQTQESAKDAMVPGTTEFAITTGNASQVIAPGYRPDMYVTQLMKGRPLMDSLSRGTLADATPFNIPAFVSTSGATGTHVEGTNPTGGTLTLGVVTVVPTAISGLFELTREIVDSANPAIDAIAMAAMNESYSQQTDGIVYSELNGSGGVGGTITSGFVPSGAQASVTSGQGDELLDGVRAATALYPFRRFGQLDRAHISQEATSSFAAAKDTTGRPLLPFIGAQNSIGTSNPNVKGYDIDGLPYQPTWSMTGNAAGDADVIAFNAADVWGWESALLMFRFEERNGPAKIDLALYGYFACKVIRPVGLVGIRHTAS